jgi:glycosyltransferase involved in cell wall biosynthesis
MKFSVLINNYNYVAYLRECIDSVLRQTFLPAEVIVVDDGSTDDSLKLLQQNYGDNPLIRIISQKNGGQFSAIDAGIQAANGEVICLLDADDRYKPDYLQSLVAVYQTNPKVDLVFCRFQALGGQAENPIWLSPPDDYDYGYTTLLTYFYFRARSACWIGNVTSCVSLKTRLAKLLKLKELGESWNYPIQADYSLLLGSSLLGGRKYYLARELVEYRIHEKNNWGLTDNRSADERYKEQVQHWIAFNFYKQRLNIGSEVFAMLDQELATVPTPLLKHVKSYRELRGKFIWKHGRLLRKSLFWQ